VFKNEESSDMKMFKKGAKILLLTLLLNSTAGWAKSDCPEVEGSPVKLPSIENDLAYFGGDAVACYFDKANDVMIRIEDTASVPKLSVFYKSTGENLLKPDPNYASGYRMLEIAEGLSGELLTDFVKRQKQKFQTYKVKGYKRSLAEPKKDAAWVDGSAFKLTVVDGKYLIYNHFSSSIYSDSVYSIESMSKEGISAKSEYSLSNSQLYLINEKDKKIHNFEISGRDIVVGDYLFRKVLSDEYLMLDVKKISQEELIAKVIENLTLFKGKQSNYPQSWLKKSVVRKGKKVSNKKRFSGMLSKRISQATEGCSVDCDEVMFSNDLDDYLVLE